jgi:hyperosmotically inducible protein
MSLSRWTTLLCGGLLAVSAVACSETDAGVTTKVKAKLVADDAVKAYQINVDTQNKVVTLSGTVDNNAAKTQAVSLARATKGVSSVVDQIVVSMPEPPVAPASAPDLTDPGLTAAVKAKLLADPTVGGLKIDVDTLNGVVTLTGTVKSAAEKAEAVRIANDTTGVRAVTDNLKIGPR